MWTWLIAAPVPPPMGDVVTEILSPDACALLPVVILCMASILCTTVWFLAVSTYTTGRHNSMA